jgi:ankyrin repeat protein
MEVIVVNNNNNNNKILKEKIETAIILPFVVLKIGMDIHQACNDGELQFVSKWLDAPRKHNDVNIKDNMGWTLLHVALANRKYDIAMFLLAHPDISVNAVNRDITTPLHYAIKVNEDEVQIEKVLEVLQTMFEKGAIISAKQKSGQTPLHEACSRGNHRIAEWLIIHGAELVRIF